MQFTRRTRLIRRAIIAFIAGAATLILTANPAAAVGPGYQYVDYFGTDGTLRGAAAANPLTRDHYDLSVADKYSDGLRVCLVIQIYNATEDREIPYCDDNNVGAAAHYQIYYNWTNCYLLVGRATSPCPN